MLSYVRQSGCSGMRTQTLNSLLMENDIMPNDNNIIPIASARPSLSQVVGMSIAELNALPPDYLDELLVQAEIAANVISIARHAITRRAALKNQP